jgi:hypothetical protein
MTAQGSDIVHYLGEPYEIVGKAGQGLFRPEMVGLEVQVHDRSYARGFHCEYRVNETIKLHKLTPGFTDQDMARIMKRKGPLVYGQRPRREERDCMVRDGKSGKMKKGKEWPDDFYSDLDAISFGANQS